MRILVLNETARPHTGGANRIALESLTVLQRAGHAVALLHHDPHPPQTPWPAFAINPLGDGMSLSKEISRIHDSFQPDVVQVHNFNVPIFDDPQFAILPACRFIHDQSWMCSGGDRMQRGGVPCHLRHSWTCLIHHYASGCGGRNPAGNWRRWKLVETRSAYGRQRRVRIQVASEFMRRGLIENAYPSGQIDVVPLFSQAPTRTAVTEPGLIVAACRLVPSKGIDVLLRALSEPGLRDLKWLLVVAGDGPERERLRALAATLGIGARVEFPGELPPEDLDSWYARCALVVSPVLRPEPFGLIGPEAMAHGKPVVAFAGGATEEWLTDQETGWVVREKSSAALSQALRKLLLSPETLERLGHGARSHWERFRPEVFVSRMVKSFESCIVDFSRCRDATSLR
jgi:glycosyltransferase involved in cell wall biosynthesis